MKLSVLFARFPFGGSEHPTVTDWLVQTVNKAKADPRISDIYHMAVDDTPITMSRNRVLLQAKAISADLVLMVDSDMKPDISGTPFWDSTLPFMLDHRGPCVVGAPYCGPPPFENVYVFRWGRKQGDHPQPDMSLDQYSREEASQLAGIQECAALPTGVILIDMRCLDRLQPPWFDYEWEDPPYNTKKATTEDVYFTRNLALAGVPQYCNWDAWAGHWKRKCVGKPQVLTTEAVKNQYREAILSGRHGGERLIEVGAGRKIQVRNGQVVPGVVGAKPV